MNLADIIPGNESMSYIEKAILLRKHLKDIEKCVCIKRRIVIKSAGMTVTGKMYN